MDQISFGGRVSPRPAGGTYSIPPDSLPGLIEPTSKEKRPWGEGSKRRDEREKGREGKGRMRHDYEQEE